MPSPPTTAGPFDIPMPTAMATSGSRNATYVHDASTKAHDDEAESGEGEPGADRLPAAELRGQARHQGATTTSPTVAAASPVLPGAG
jgi:hypothetical protein